MPPYKSRDGNVLSSSCVTMPKLGPPPLRALKRSACFEAVALTTLPSARTTWGVFVGFIRSTRIPAGGENDLVRNDVVGGETNFARVPGVACAVSASVVRLRNTGHMEYRLTSSQKQTSNADSGLSSARTHQPARLEVRVDPAPAVSGAHRHGALVILGTSSSLRFDDR